MDQFQFPRILIDKYKLKNNIKKIVEVCEARGIAITGVIKGVNGLPGVIDIFLNNGLVNLGSSRLSQLKMIKEKNESAYTVALRIPMLSELNELITYADCSLNSELLTLQKLNDICTEKGVYHDVVIMNDLGDLREGLFETEDLIETAVYVERELKNLNLKGIGTNLGCYGSIEPDDINLGQLINNARIIESKIGRKLDWISGGATTSLPLVLNRTMPNGINHLRIGDGIFLRDMEMYFDYTFNEMYRDAFIIEGEIIEIHDKPSYPVGTISVDAFGNKPEYKDIGVHKRALLAMGRQDVGDIEKLIPKDKKINVIGGSSDHTIIDITNSDNTYQLGDIISFELQYENLLYSCTSEYVHKNYI